jgi:hypothetical protein
MERLRSYELAGKTDARLVEIAAAFREHGAMKTRLALTLVSVLAVAAPAATAKSGGGTGYVGFNGSGDPVAIQVARSGKQIARAAMELHMTCTSGDQFPFIDRYRGVRVSKSGAFRSSFTNQIVDEGQGKTAVLSGSLVGKFNKARTKITGTWHFHDDEKDATGALTDQCDSGTAHFSATQ